MTKLLLILVTAVGFATASDLKVQVEPTAVTGIIKGEVVRVGYLCDGETVPTLMGYYVVDKVSKSGHLEGHKANQTERARWNDDPDKGSVIVPAINCTENITIPLTEKL